MKVILSLLLILTTLCGASESACTNENCNAGWTIKDRGGPDGAGYTMVSSDKEIPCDGFITHWRYQAKASQPFRAIVWRRVAGSSTQFKIVGINDIPAGLVNQEVNFVLPESERVEVKAGDVIGWSSGPGVLAYNGGGGFLVRWLPGSLHSTLEINQIHDVNGGSGDREYSIAATVKPLDDENCNVGWAIKDRGGPDGAGYTMVSPDKEIPCDGFITHWRYQAKASHPFRAIVWRRVAGSSTRFKIVGINDIPAGQINQEVNFALPESERVAVQAGDIIGWSCGPGVLAYNGGGGFLVRWLSGSLHSALEVNQIRDVNSGSGDREYSIAATVKRLNGGHRTTGWAIKGRAGPDGAGYTMVSPEKTFTCEGVITHWRYQAKASHPFRAIVWRRVAGSSTQFKIVGFNDIPAGPIDQEATFLVPESDRIQVMLGDMIGWSSGSGVLTYNGGGGTKVRWVDGNLHNTLQDNQVIDISSGAGDREYSIAAVLEV